MFSKQPSSARKRRYAFVLLPLLLVVGAAIGVLYYQSKSAERAEQQAFQVLEEAAALQAETLNTAIKGKLDVLRIVSAVLPEQSDALEDKAAVGEYLRRIADNYSFSRVFIIDPDGVAEAEGGNYSLGERQYFLRAMAGEEAVSVFSMDSARLIAAVPVMYRGEILGVLSGVFAPDSLSELLAGVYSGEGYSFVCDQAGQVRICSHEQEAVLSADNVLIAPGLTGRYGEDAAATAERIGEDIKTGGSGFFAYDHMGERRFCAYKPLGINDWTVFTAVPDAMVEREVSASAGNGFALIAIESGIALALMLTIFFLERARQKELEEEARMLRISDERLGIVMESTSLTVWDYDLLTKCIIQTERSARTHGIAGEIITDVPESLIRMGHVHPDSVKAYREMYESLHSGEKKAGGVFRLRAPDGEGWIYESITYAAAADENGVTCRAVGISEDVTEQYSARLKYEQEVRFQMALTGDACASAILDLTEREVVRVSNKPEMSGVETEKLTFAAFLDQASRRVVGDERVRGLFDSLTAEDLIEIYRAGRRELTFEYQRSMPQGDRWVREELRLIEEPDNEHIMLFVVLRDIDGEKRREANLAKAAETDSMTGLLNHRTTLARIDEYLKGEGAGGTHALFMVDIDRFKSINDTEGHQVGDRAIIAVAAAIKKLFRPEDIVGRMGGDEFVAFMKNVADDDIIFRRASALVQALQIECTGEQCTLHITGSVGVACCRGGMDIDSKALYAMADAALYEAKSNGRNRWEASPELMSGWEEELRESGSPIGTVPLHALMEYMDGGVLLTEVGEKLTCRYLSPSYFRLLGLPASTPPAGFDVLAAVFEKDRAEVEATIRSAAECGDALELTYRVSAGYGTPRWHHARMVQIPSESGVPTVLSVVSDVTESKRLEKTLSETRRPVVVAREAEAMGNVRRTVLVVDDEPINCRMLEKILSDEYTVLKAENGLEALEILKKFPEDIAAVLLDLMMPVMDGRAFLEAKRKNEDIAEIPVLVVSAAGEGDKNAEAGALSGGAWDYLTKPYRPDIIRFRLKNAIIRSQLAAFDRLKYLSEYDELTGLPNKRKFFASARAMLMGYPEKRFVFIRFDVNWLTIINSYFGVEEGDKLLAYIARGLDEFFGTRDDCAYGRIESDVFGVCMPYESRAEVERVLSHSREVLRRYELDFNLVPTFGLYIIEDHSLSMEKIYERANLAARSCKGDYINCFAFYTPEMSREMEREHEITGEMDEALEGGQFEVWLQPQLSLRTGRISGAEALTRWRHPEKGIIAPGEFIPIFERNGFITKLDHYVWERTCETLRRWMDTSVRVVPLSVNISRVNLYNPRLAETITELADEYGVPHELMNLEVTESACAEGPALMADTLASLREAGFRIHMDDFGTGYSSLTSLRELPVDVMKIDMRFLSSAQESDKGESILAYTVELARALGMETVVEGVERKEQAEYLAAAGCDLGQGYYFAKPMPIESFEELLRREDNKS